MCSFPSFSWQHCQWCVFFSTFSQLFLNFILFIFGHWQLANGVFFSQLFLNFFSILFCLFLAIGNLPMVCFSAFSG